VREIVEFYEVSRVCKTRCLRVASTLKGATKVGEQLTGRDENFDATVGQRCPNCGDVDEDLDLLVEAMCAYCAAVWARISRESQR
jgi:hypothetical protein